VRGDGTHASPVYFRGDNERFLSLAVGSPVGADMKLYAAVARRRIGTLQDHAPGRERQRQAEE
jgi:hypothetical protein